MSLQTHRRLAFFKEARLIRMESGVVVVAKKSVRISGDLLHHRPMAPENGAEDLFHSLAVALGHIVVAWF